MTAVGMSATYPGGSLTARRAYPRARARDEGRYGDLATAGGEFVYRTSRPKPASSLANSSEETFERFRNRMAPAESDIKENVFDKPGADPFRHDAQYTASHISIAPPEMKLELTLKDRRSRPLPNSLRPATLDILEKPLRCLGGKTNPYPAGHSSDDRVFDGFDAARVPPQPIPAETQKQEDQLIQALEQSLRDGQTHAALWDQYAKRAEELLITMSLEKILRILKAFVLAKYRGAGIYTHIGGELAKEVKNASSTRLCQVLHWVARSGLRDQTLMTLIGNETLLRLSDDLVLDMYIEVLNVHAKLDVRSPRLLGSIVREMCPLFADFGKDQCCAVTPLTVMNVFSEPARVAYLSRCAELGIGLPVRMTKPSVLRQFRLLEDCLRLDYHPTSLPNVVQLWLANLKNEADAQDIVEPTPLSATEQDILRILQEEMDIAASPGVQDGIFTLHLVMGRSAIEVLDSYEDYYVTPALGGNQKLLRADTKLRQRLLWRRGWRIINIEQQDWAKLTDDLYKKDMLEELLVNAARRAPQA